MFVCYLIYNYNMCVRLSVRPTTVPRFNWLAEPARTVGFPKKVMGITQWGGGEGRAGVGGERGGWGSRGGGRGGVFFFFFFFLFFFGSSLFFLGVAGVA
jgi:hypothetical protein